MAVLERPTGKVTAIQTGKLCEFDNCCCAGTSSDFVSTTNSNFVWKN
jgi:hypothetical protein